MNIRFWNWEELNHIKAICSKAGHAGVLGWADLNSQGKISIADNTDNLYRYSLASPEWFAQFVSDGFHIPANKPYDKKAFYKRDYSSARKNIELLCEKMMSSSEIDILNKKAYPNITLEEKNEILNFFEKYWKIFANEKSIPKCALIKRFSINRTNEIKTYKEYCKLAQDLNFDDYSLERAIDFLISSKEHDTQLETNIDFKNILLINLPEYNKIH